MSSSFAPSYSTLSSKPRRASTGSAGRSIKGKTSSKSPLRTSPSLVGVSGSSLSKRSNKVPRDKNLSSSSSSSSSSTVSPSSVRSSASSGSTGRKNALSRRDSLDLNERRDNTDKEERELRMLLAKYGRSSSLSEEREADPVSSSRFEDEEEKDAEESSFHGESALSFAKRSRNVALSKHVRGILSTAKPLLDRNPNNGRRKVTFNRMATVHHMPGHEQVAARRSRKGPWEPAPEHDELWDGDLQEFRPVPLTSRELKDLLQRRDREASFGADEFSAFGMSYTYPPASYEYSSYADGDMDELDSYLNEMPFSSSYDASRLSSSAISHDAGSDHGCFVCQAPVDWAPRHVSSWIRDHVAGGDFLCMHFDEHFVDGPMLLQMEERDLRNIGIKRRADRLAILSATKEVHRGSLAKNTCACAGASLHKTNSNNSSHHQAPSGRRGLTANGSPNSSHDVFDRHSQFLKDSESFLKSF